MKRHLFIPFSLFMLSVLMLGMTQEAAAENELVGSPKCKGCHQAKTGDQWKIWSESGHAKAFETLGSEAARKIADDQGLGDPQKAAACLKCHVTNAFLGSEVAVSPMGAYAEADGVGCEACHGPGSAYKLKKVMVDPAAAVAAGLVSVLSADACVRCHNEESPTFKGFDFEKRWAEIAHPVTVKE